MKASDILLSLRPRNLSVGKDVNGNVYVEYEHSDVKDGSFLVGFVGRGPDFESACEEYLSYIRGKTIVFDAYTKERKEVVILG